MIIKFIKQTKKYRVGQVVKADFKLVYRHIKSGDAVESNEDELIKYISKIN
tara:strand:- start:65 stop:217 length:153 start_codon:yes stop_codon:yes gene_type:complete